MKCHRRDKRNQIDLYQMVLTFRFQIINRNEFFKSHHSINSRNNDHHHHNVNGEEHSPLKKEISII
ncbi:hypothetical protein TVAG_518260 [Trichomonas vaginalis G3]|uniref:Uncharacterized protein n=1 Tax=Trichomonas vaginalis (strain ATCC PRA-98 / G3) TaxID=412133 RepID=A2HM49_TRIV3|nr:hypothetical protein TVAGG3_0568870 [Trichomonas vaginalis G3]EAX69518.1 hypothetical protein TVAG_518260 [Trichomonas vaginalis G3]KAI5521767.1 hypothetical protein TVAGG3_0568870 [Trichomonas vaginalis G3]|eukprot:XP_001282448.1 hypothetical protein [Trichomonas vaginalis G3]